MASRGDSSEKRKKILEELQQKACELSTILGSEVTTKTSSNPLNQAGSSGSSSSSSRSYMPSFWRQFTTSGHNPFRGKGKGPFMRDVILLTGPDINSVPRQGKTVYCQKNKDKTLGLSGKQNAQFIDAYQHQRSWGKPSHYNGCEKVANHKRKTKGHTECIDSNSKKLWCGLPRRHSKPSNSATRSWNIHANLQCRRILDGRKLVNRITTMKPPSLILWQRKTGESRNSNP